MSASAHREPAVQAILPDAVPACPLRSPPSLSPRRPGRSRRRAPLPRAPHRAVQRTAIERRQLASGPEIGHEAVQRLRVRAPTGNREITPREEPVDRRTDCPHRLVSGRHRHRRECVREDRTGRHRRPATAGECRRMMAAMSRGIARSPRHASARARRLTLSSITTEAGVVRARPTAPAVRPEGASGQRGSRRPHVVTSSSTRS
jgi:hypothetical protein